MTGREKGAVEFIPASMSPCLWTGLDTQFMEIATTAVWHNLFLPKIEHLPPRGENRLS